MNRTIVLNPKGGCGKTTIATNLAAYYASSGMTTALLDYDPQGSSLRWARQRPTDLPTVHAIDTMEKFGSQVTRAWSLRVPPQTQQIVMDVPAGVTGGRLQEYLRNIDSILIPVMPSAIDVHAVTRFIQELLLQGKVKQRGIKVGIIANRVKTKTVAYQSLCQFLSTIKLPFIASLRDSQYYVAAAEHGLGIHEMDCDQVETDKENWKQLFNWLDTPAMEYRHVEPGF